MSRQRASFIAYASAGLIVLVCLFSHLGAIGLVGPDEPRYAWIARAMASSGDWVTPRLYGQPWFEKPVLYYWAAALGFLIHLPAEWAARLPSAFAALVAAIAIGWLGWKFYGAEAWPFGSPFVLAPLIFSTSVAAMGFARAAGPDMLFSATLTVTMASGAIALSRRGALRFENDKRASTGPSDHSALALFGASLGLAVLAKGPAGVLLAAGAIGIWTLATSRWRRCYSAGPSNRHCRILPGRDSLVRALRAPQSGFSPGLYLSTQFRALPHSPLPASPAILVFRPDSSARVASVDGVPLACSRGRAATLAAEILEQLARILYRLLGDIPFSVF